MLGTPILSKIKFFISNDRLCIRLPKKMSDELDIKKEDYVIPVFVERDDNKKDDVFGKSKLVLVFYRNKSGKLYDPTIELESDRDV